MEAQATLFDRKCANILPSPPISPSTYACPSASGERGWYTTTLASPQVLSTPSATLSLCSTESLPPACDEKISALQGSSPRLKRGPPNSSSLHQTITVEKFKSVSSNIIITESTQPDILRREDSRKARPACASSTTSQTKPELLLAKPEHESDGEELFTGSEEEFVAGAPQDLKQGVERLAEKRKMKRFRLTHAQTRYLSSEFSRQPHPDAAQRERLSQDIPGLNPRQVQVWFQNKRAKLKRLTTDDQERMRISRALPLDFDFSQALYPTSRESRPPYGPALIDPLMLGGGANQRPSLRLGMGHIDTAFNIISSSFTHHIPSTVSANSSTDPSSVSSANRPLQSSSPYFSSTQSHLATSPHSTNPFGRSHSLSSDSMASHRQNQTFNQNRVMELSCRRGSTTSLPISSLANDNYGYGDLPPQQTTMGPTQASGLGLSQYLSSSVNLPNTFSYDQSRMLSPSGSALPASSYCQSQDTSVWRGSQMMTQEYQYGQQSQPL